MKILYPIILFLIIASCNKVVKDETFFPSIESFTRIQEQNTWEYEIDSMVYKPNSYNPTLVKYFLKDSVASSHLNSKNLIEFLVYRYKKNDSMSAWIPLYSYTVHTENHQYIVNINNTPIVAMEWPLFVNKQWNGYKYSNYSNQYIIVEDPTPIFSVSFIGKYQSNVFSVDSAIYINGINFILGDANTISPSTILISQKEIYGKNIGMVYKYDEAWSVGINHLDSGKRDGYLVEYKLLNYK